MRVQVDIVRVSIFPLKDQPILFVNPDGTPTKQVALQVLEPVARWNSKIGFLSRGIQDLQFPKQRRLDCGGYFPVALIIFVKGFQP